MNELYSLQVNGTKVTEIIGPYENPADCGQNAGRRKWRSSKKKTSKNRFLNETKIDIDGLKFLLLLSHVLDVFEKLNNIILFLYY
jgi:hypothetical protein